MISAMPEIDMQIPSPLCIASKQAITVSDNLFDLQNEGKDGARKFPLFHIIKHTSECLLAERCILCLR
jgi:hypothetical protein